MSQDTQTPVPVGDLAEMIAAQRRLVEGLRPCSGPGCEQLTAHERTLRFLEEELRRRMPESQARAHTPMQAAQRVADVFQFQVPGSHRQQLGRAITAAKSVFTKGLKPFHVEMLRPQHAFNREMLAVLEHLFGMRATSTQTDLSEWVRKRLTPLLEPTEWEIPTHRRQGLGRAVRLVKRSYLTALGPLLRELLAGQRQWNQQAVDLLADAVKPRPPSPDEAASRVAELLNLADPLGRAQSLGARVSSPLWREVFRRQITYNQEITLCLADMLGTRTPASVPSQDDYAAWYREREPQAFARAAEAVKGLQRRPLVSLITVVSGTPEPLLRACIESVRAQSYENWELCLADDGTKAPQAARVLEKFAREDSRIRVARPGASGRAAAANAALALAQGELVGLLGEGDLLSPHTLAEVVLRLEREPETDLLYSDEDRCDESGRRFEPFFKPDWSPDLMRSVNYIHHFAVVRRALLDAVGAMRPEFEGAQDYDLLLRLSERARHIGHVPAVLYHRRGSGGREGREATDAAVRALNEHLKRQGEEGVAEAVGPGHYRVRYPVKGQPLVSIIVPFKDKPELLRTLTTSLLGKTAYSNYELLLVSNNSKKPETFALLESLTDPRIRKLTWDHPFNYPAINNFAAREARGELLLFLNNDIEIIHPDWLEELIGQAQRPEVGQVGAKLLFPDGTVQHAGVMVGMTGFAGHPFWRLPDEGRWTPFGLPDWTRDFLAVTSACVMVRREFFEALRGFDERFIVCGSDVDLGLRTVGRGLRVVYTPHAKLYHHESASRRLDSMPEGDFWESFVSYRPYLRDGDPFYNPNLTLLGPDCSLRRHPENGEELALRTLSRDLPSAQDPAAVERARRQRHVADHLSALDHTSAQVREARAQAPARLAALRQKGKLERVTWFLPSFHHPYAGIHTILRFAQLLRERHGTQSEFIIYDNPGVTAAEMAARVSVLFPKPPGTFRVLQGLEEVADLPECDLAVATLWKSAYPVLSHPRATAKAYFVQDFEPAFLPAGAESALAEQTYRLGLYGIFNTRGLHDYITSHYPMEGCWFEPAVERSIFHAQRPRRQGPIRIFFYGRPGSERNAFELGMATLRQLKAELGGAVEIVSAGERWSPEHYGLQGVITNLGVLPYEKTADLYRECDVGLCFMFTKHPSYLPFELMACGVTVVTNDNPANRWLLEHERNCLLAEPTLSCILEQLRRAVADTGLRARLSAAAIERVGRTTWEEQVDQVLAQLLGRT
ncbi:rhamnosyltransferase WsaF family glycosyltransferase [Hyalangium gracile]|uniref:rhamnosyltransferase WsaF family glycosyltransferase n=1 Tax=Hyalangium gracile TaxID=394092 RepID=UPI001CCEB29B|nr:glycosyltransferase [Hyalangium gracile]